jgi:2,3-bisphosphoglycerate-dependent phosphoglycerate mutase
MTNPARTLVLARHGQSLGNAQNVFTGWRDSPLTAKGEEEAKYCGRILRDRGLRFDAAFTSTLSRALRSCELMLTVMQNNAAEIYADAALNERNYGDLTSLNKDAARERFGAEQVEVWRRSYADSPPNGESLRDTIARVLPYYLANILPTLMRTRCILVVAHGNSLRSLILGIENVKPADISAVELGTGEMRMYGIDDDTSIVSREILKGRAREACQ